MKSILFVDDHELLAQVSCEILEMHGYHAVAAGSASEALQRFSQEKFDAVVTDLRMEGIDGLELARLLHQQQAELPVILITGYEPVTGNPDIVTCIPKQGLFPALVNHLKACIGESEPLECGLKSA